MVADSERARSIALIRLLIEDVLAARKRVEAADTQTARRDTVRASLAAMEGMIWLAREHVRSVLATFEQLTPIADLALQEQVYTITDTGDLLIQSRSVPLPTAVRFLFQQARLIDPVIAAELSHAGWAHFKQAISIRNRITHPKPESDMHVSNGDLSTVASGLSWLTATIDYLMAATNLALVHRSEMLAELVDRLKAGDPEAIAEYNAALGPTGPE